MTVESLYKILKSRDFKDKSGAIYTFYNDTVFRNKEYVVKYRIEESQPDIEGLAYIKFEAYKPHAHLLLENLIIIYDRDKYGEIGILVNFIPGKLPSAGKGFNYIININLL